MTEDMGVVGRVAPRFKALNMQPDQAGVASASKHAERRELEEYRAAPCGGSVYSGLRGLCCVVHTH